MHRTLTYCAVIAWAMLQLPLVLCQSGCGDESACALLIAEHSCHDEDSDAHKTRCESLCDCTEHPSDNTDHDHEDGDEGEHVIVHLPTTLSGSDVALPQPVVTLDMLSDTCVATATITKMRHHGERGRNDPPSGAAPIGDPVTASDRLLV